MAPWSAGENGQLALRSLASSTFSTLLPKIETRGQLGSVGWRLVGAPSLPNILGVLDPLADASGAGLDPYKLLSSLAVGGSGSVGFGAYPLSPLSVCCLGWGWGWGVKSCEGAACRRRAVTLAGKGDAVYSTHHTYDMCLCLLWWWWGCNSGRRIDSLSLCVQLLRCASHAATATGNKLQL